MPLLRSALMLIHRAFEPLEVVHTRLKGRKRSVTASRRLHIILAALAAALAAGFVRRPAIATSSRRGEVAGYHPRE